MKPISELSRVLWKVRIRHRGPAVAIHRVTKKTLLQMSPEAPIQVLASIPGGASSNMWGSDDLLWVIEHWGEPDANGTVDIDDLLFVVTHWGSWKIPANQVTNVPWLEYWGWRVNGATDAVIADVSKTVVATQKHCILQDNSPAVACTNLYVKNVTLDQVPGYLLYDGAGIANAGYWALNATQRAFANQAFVRLAAGTHNFYGLVLDNSQAVNDVFRTYGKANVVVDGFLLKGGIINVGWKPGDPDGSSNGGTTTFRNGTFTHHQPNPGSPPYPKGFKVYPGMGPVILKNTWFGRPDGTSRPMTFADLDLDAGVNNVQIIP